MKEDKFMAKYLYRTIAEKIIQEISSGQLLPGEPVPSSRKLSQRYGVNQLTTIN
jgi:DNA-binding GntR family transcriptional regulator